MWSLFKDKNEINEKNVVGFASFVVMVLFAVADLGTSVIADKDLIITRLGELRSKDRTRDGVTSEDVWIYLDEGFRLID